MTATSGNDWAACESHLDKTHEEGGVTTGADSVKRKIAWLT